MILKKERPGISKKGEMPNRSGLFLLYGVLSFT